MTPHGEPERPTAGSEDALAAPAAADQLSAIYFGGHDGRRLKWAAVVAIAAHMLLFTVMLPDFSRDLPDLTRDLMIIKRYEPPPLEQVERKQVKRAATRVPIPDPTPTELEPIMPDEDEELPDLPVDTVFIADQPLSSPLPGDFLDALDMETVNLQPPRVKHRVQPRYDRERARRGIQGSVDLQILVDAAGLVTFARVVTGSGDDELDRLALEAVRQWEFVPAVLEGTPVAVRAVVTINFRIY